MYDIRSLRVNDLTIILLTWRKWWANNVSKQQMGFNSGFKELILQYPSYQILLFSSFDVLNLRSILPGKIEVPPHNYNPPKIF